MEFEHNCNNSDNKIVLTIKFNHPKGPNYIFFCNIAILDSSVWMKKNSLKSSYMCPMSSFKAQQFIELLTIWYELLKLLNDM